MGWIKLKIKSWLGISQLEKKTTDLWWDLHDAGRGAVPKWKEHERVMDSVLKMIVQPDKRKTTTLKKEGTYYHTVESSSRFAYTHPDAMLKEENPKNFTDWLQASPTKDKKAKED